MGSAYLDNNATTPTLPAVADAVAAALAAGPRNPSSVHSFGDHARELVARAREQVAQLLGARPEQLVFTSSGTEANNLALASVFRNGARRPRVITASVEHSSVLRWCQAEWAQGLRVDYVRVDDEGRVVLADLVSIQWANNETGVVQDIDAIGAMCRARGVPLHTDGAQALGKLPIDVQATPADFLTGTAHKLHGPTGVGVLFARDRRRLHRVLHGGDQESGARAGTENVPGIVGFGRAAGLRHEHLAAHIERLRALRDEFEAVVLDGVPDAHVNGDPARRVCNTTNLRFPGVDGQALVAQLDQHGVQCSQSSACTAARPEPSYVLRAMGLSEVEAYESVRFSVSVLNTPDEASYAAKTVVELCARLRAFTRRRRMTLPQPQRVS